jgi:hypothetical protein
LAWQINGIKDALKDPNLTKRQIADAFDCTFEQVRTVQRSMGIQFRDVRLEHHVSIEELQLQVAALTARVEELEAWSRKTTTPSK